MIGGCVTDDQAATTLPGLWAAGEVTSTGLHGANRLASNSLLEGLVFGRRAGRNAARLAAAMPDRFAVPSLWANPPADPVKTGGPEPFDLTDLRNSLGAEMWRDAGIQRDQAGLESALRQVEFWSRYVGPHVFTEPRGWELQNMLLVARLMILGALARRESRGTHLRMDHPRPDPAQSGHLVLQAEVTGFASPPGSAPGAAGLTESSGAAQGDQVCQDLPTNRGKS
jgi:L-aspartate oxidase